MKTLESWLLIKKFTIIKDQIGYHYIRKYDTIERTFGNNIIISLVSRHGLMVGSRRVVDYNNNALCMNAEMEGSQGSARSRSNPTHE